MRVSKNGSVESVLFAAGLAMFGVVVLPACKKTVISDKVTPVATEAPKKEGEIVADTVAKIKLVGGCDPTAAIGRKVQISVIGIQNSQPISFECTKGSGLDEMTFDIPVSTQVCNQNRIVANLKTPDDWGYEGVNALSYTRTLSYMRSTALPDDSVYFKIRGASSGQTLDVGFEDHISELMAIDQKCQELGAVESEKFLQIPVFGDKDVTCKEYLSNEKYRGGIDHNDVKLLFSSPDPKVKFVLEGDPKGTCFEVQ